MRYAHSNKGGLAVGVEPLPRQGIIEITDDGHRFALEITDRAQLEDFIQLLRDGAEILGWQP